MSANKIVSLKSLRPHIHTVRAANIVYSRQPHDPRKWVGVTFDTVRHAKNHVRDHVPGQKGGHLTEVLSCMAVTP